MSALKNIKVGNTLYDFLAAALSSDATIDGVAFNGGDSVVHYGTCATAAATAAKLVSLGNDITLDTGARVTVKFTYANTAANPTLSVNGSTAKAIMAYGTTAAGNGSWVAGETVTFEYDGTYWQMVNGGIASTSNYGRVKLDAAPTNGSMNAPTSDGVYAALALKAPLASPALTGNPTSPTQNAGDNSTKIATTAYADGAVATEKARAETAEATKADQNGTYENLTAGFAQHLISSVGFSNSAPYLYRAIPAGAGNMEQMRGITGATIAWNQLVASDAVSVTVPNSHKYVAYISGAWSIGVSDGTAITVSGANGDMVTDLTAYFGSATIADYVYALEQATPGAGIAWLRSYGFFPAGVSHAYDAGSLQSVCVGAHKTVGFNQWDEEWEEGAIDLQTGENFSASGRIRCKNYIPVIQNTAYYFKCGAGQKLGLFAYDADTNYIGTLVGGEWRPSESNSDIGNTVITMPSGCAYLKIRCIVSYGSVYNHDICINLSDPAKNGTYEPYNAHTYPLDSTKKWRGIYKLVDGALVADGDVYPPSGSATRKYGIVDLGSLAWSKSGNIYISGSGFTNPAKYNTVWDAIAGDICCPKYVEDTPNNVSSGTNDKTIALTPQSKVCVVDSAGYADGTAFKTAMSGVYLVYELATPTSETADPYQENQAIEAGGTEEFIDAAVAAGTRDVAVPPMADEFFPLDAAEVLDAPTTDGTYNLRVTVSGGVPTYSWVSA